MRTTGRWNSPSDLPVGRSKPYGWVPSPISPLSVEIEWSSFGDFQKLLWGLTEAFFWIQLVGEGSFAFKRGLGETQARARLKNAEGSAFQYNQMNGAIQTKE